MYNRLNHVEIYPTSASDFIIKRHYGKNSEVVIKTTLTANDTLMILAGKNSYHFFVTAEGYLSLTPYYEGVKQDTIYMTATDTLDFIIKGGAYTDEKIHLYNL